MDPLSITASIAGLITLAGVIISKGFQLSDRFANSEKELDSLLSEVSIFSGLLVGVQSHFQHDQASSNAPSSSRVVPEGQSGVQMPTALVKHIQTALKDCNAILEDVKKLVEKLVICISAHEEESNLVISLMKDQLEVIGSAQKRLEEKHEAEIQSKMKDEIFEWLGDATVAAHSDALESRHPESGTWFLSSPEFTGWISGDFSYFCLDGIGSHFSTVFLVIDGIDEFAQFGVLLRIIQDIPLASETFRVLISSRSDATLIHSLSNFRHISLSCDRIHNDIERYVRSRVSNFRWHDVPDIEEIIEGLVKGADGMFLWAAYQLDSLSRIRTAISKSALKSLPRGLGRTYENILSKLSDEDKRLAIKILQFILFSEHGLHSAELIEAVAIEAGQVSLQQLKENKLRSEDDIFEICSNLIRRSKATGHIMLAHHSVREFLISPSLESGESNPFYICDTDTTAEIAISCLTYLNFKDFGALSLSQDITDIVLDGLVVEHPFLGYATCNWSHHISDSSFKPQCLLETLITKFFDPNRGNFEFWVTFAQYTYGHFRIPSKLTPLHSALHKAIELGDKDSVISLLSAGANVNVVSHDGATAFSIAAENHWTGIMHEIAMMAETNRTLPDGRTTLHLAAQSGDIKTAAYLIGRDKSVLHRKDRNKWTALHFAAHHGQAHMVEFLLEQGIKPSLDINEWSPAHSAIQHRDPITLKRLLRSSWSTHYVPSPDPFHKPGWQALLHNRKYGYTGRFTQREPRVLSGSPWTTPTHGDQMQNISQDSTLISGSPFNVEENLETFGYPNDSAEPESSLRSDLSLYKDAGRNLPSGERFGSLGGLAERGLGLSNPPSLTQSASPSLAGASLSVSSPLSSSRRRISGAHRARIHDSFPLEFRFVIRSLLELTISLNYPDAFECLLECQAQHIVVELDHLELSMETVQSVNARATLQCS
ncbi:hypothetical protein MGYG_08981 [Nannizzia gypsea CBS 118893]|uniref:Uncharacterized protein n=1 Tax=Arthroderma gypseum (strain ATCC MYA-4604 / CBS 118893) TaxID=535722 RepID=E4UMY0_ARTGP|nr:hypothetical protein MGYG_08981 [Nannizzia gypsea CBS 118893]EFQ99494.1 hypothetical protein MGYG_08981 [Nannizzia gypsea CBS 118893]